MKHGIRLVGIGLMMVYLLAVCTASLGSFSSDAGATPSAGQSPSLTVVSNSLINHAPQSEGAMRSLTNVQLPTFKLHPDELGAVQDTPPKRHCRTFLAEVQAAVKHHIQVLTAALVFPFHVFW